MSGRHQRTWFKLKVVWTIFRRGCSAYDAPDKDKPTGWRTTELFLFYTVTIQYQSKRKQSISVYSKQSAQHSWNPCRRYNPEEIKENFEQNEAHTIVEYFTCDQSRGEELLSSETAVCAKDYPAEYTTFRVYSKFEKGNEATRIEGAYLSQEEGHQPINFLGRKKLAVDNIE